MLLNNLGTVYLMSLFTVYAYRIHFSHQSYAFPYYPHLR